MNTTKIVEDIDRNKFFQQSIKKNKLPISTSPHALYHLSLAQRKIYKEEELKRILLHEKPLSVGRQKNGRYALFYRRKKGFLKLIIEFKKQKLEIITFINVDIIPNLRTRK